ncbi:cyanophycin metabolism-associated DUF1854 family protein [Denitromonas iodatirespirans]|uniref:DUF1854 domain-containing protein n=1 Tax=Denitromonas iodatirespirans TaxID=2795389 RepID=A0A944DCZ5_DENI1|nr:DUF1854 domain-containing protein [Denitromonas iodatirespirans]MBT0960468.1 DUF1854 domain-containing protein [Denitromonas iodatirespirans]
MTTPAMDFTLTRSPFGHLCLTDAEGVRHEQVQVVRAFPIAAPDEGISLLSADGHELAWIAHLDQLDANTRRLIEDTLAARDFMPVLLRLKSVSSFATPSTWEVDTDRGPTRLVLRGEENIRRLPGGMLMIADEHGIQYLIRKLRGLDAHSRKLLDRFL